MKQKYLLLGLAQLVLFVLLTTSLSVLAATPNLELAPSTQSVTVGNQATINVEVEEVTNLRGANITLNFNASKLQYVSSAYGGFIPSATLMDSSANGSVTLDIAGLGATAYASGSGTIMTVIFNRIASGDTNITFGSTTLRDKDNITITHTKGTGCLLTSLVGDFNADGGVEFEDLMIFAMAYGSCTGNANWNPVCDLNADGCIEFEDLMLFAMNYGLYDEPCPPPSASTLSDPGSSLPSPATYTVSWSSVSGATSYKIQEATNSSFTSGLQEYTTSSNSRSFSHTVTTTTTYYYRVVAVDDCGQSGWSNVEDIVIVPDSGNKVFLETGGTLNGTSINPSDPTLTVNSGESITGTLKVQAIYSGPSSNVVPFGYTPSWGSHSSSYITVISDLPVGTSPYDVSINLNPPTTPGTYYLILASNCEMNLGWTMSQTNWTTGTMSWDDGNDIADLTESELQESLSTGYLYLDMLVGSTYNKSTYGIAYVKINVGSCETPNPPTLSDPGSSLPSPATYTVSWSSVSGATSYKIQEATNSSFTNGLQEYTASSTSRSFSHTVSSTTTYYYRVAAVNSCGQGSWSSTVDMIVSVCVLPSTPTLSDPGSSLPSPATYTVSWSSVSGATSYKIQEATNSSFTNGLQEYTTSSTSRSFSHTVSSTTTYYYRVAAINSCGQGSWSSTVDMIVNPLQYTLSTHVSPSSSYGYITPSGGTYTVGTQVTLTAHANYPYEFDHWGGDAGGTSTSITITMDSNKSVVAYFKGITYTLTTSVSPSGSGYVTPSSGSYAAGTVVTLTATPNPNASRKYEYDYDFDCWSGDVGGTSTSTTITMDSNKNVTANFVRNYWERRAFLIGVGEYMYAEPDLPAPPYDMMMMDSTLEYSEFGSAHRHFSYITLLNDTVATRQNILSGISSAFSGADYNDVSYFYFSGHGVYGYICPTDSLTDSYANDISVSTLEIYLLNVPGYKVVLLDCCYSGKFINKGQEVSSFDVASFNEHVIDVFSNSNSKYLSDWDDQFQVLTACTKDQLSTEFSGGGIEPYGLFTKTLCQGIGYDGWFLADSDIEGNGDTQVSLHEAHFYVVNNIEGNIPPPYVLEQDIRIHPWGSEFVIADN